MLDTMKKGLGLAIPLAALVVGCQSQTLKHEPELDRGEISHVYPSLAYADGSILHKIPTILNQEQALNFVQQFAALSPLEDVFMYTPQSQKLFAVGTSKGFDRVFYCEEDLLECIRANGRDKTFWHIHNHRLLDLSPLEKEIAAYEKKEVPDQYERASMHFYGIINATPSIDDMEGYTGLLRRIEKEYLKDPFFRPHMQFYVVNPLGYCAISLQGIPTSEQVAKVEHFGTVIDHSYQKQRYETRETSITFFNDEAAKLFRGTGGVFSISFHYFEQPFTRKISFR